VKQNVGGMDRYARIAIGIVLVLLGTVGNGLIGGQGIGLPVSVVGIIVMGTGVFRFCALYSLIGVNTACKIAPKDVEKKEGE